MTHRTVLEWGRAPIGPGGYSATEAEALVAAARRHPLGGEHGAAIVADHRHFLRAGQMVGVLAAPGCSLEILPKVDPVGESVALDGTQGGEAASVRGRLVALLDLALGLDIGAGASAAMARGADNLLEILSRLFAERLLAEARRGLPRLYVARADDLPVLRGRLDVGRQFTRHAVRPDILACRFDELSGDIALTRIMRAAVRVLRRASRSPATRRLLDELWFLLADVADVPLAALPWDAVRIDRGNQRWTGLVELARLLIGRDWQSTTRRDAREEDGISLLFPMHALFEAATATLARRALAGSGMAVVAQGGLRHCLGDWREGEDCAGDRFQTRPDLLLRRGAETVAIIDTKWKRLVENPLDPKRGVSQADVYQMMAYARLYRCDRLMLLYPAPPGAPPTAPRRFGIDGGGELLAVGEIDLSVSPSEAQRRVADLISGLTRPAQVRAT